MATAQILLHRFYFSKSLVKYPVEITVMACIFLASKLEECRREIGDVLNVFQHIKQIRNKSPLEPLSLNKFNSIKNIVFDAELRVH